VGHFDNGFENNNSRIINIANKLEEILNRTNHDTIVNMNTSAPEGSSPLLSLLCLIHDLLTT